MSTPLSRQMDQMAETQEWKERAEQAEARLGQETKRCADIADNALRACITDEERDIATTIRNLILAAAQPEEEK